MGKWYFREAFKYIANNPIEWGKIMLRKFLIFWHGYEFEPNNNIDYIRSHSSVLRITLSKLFGFFYFPFGIVAPFALVGIILSLKNNYRFDKKLMLFYFCLISYISAVIIFLVKARYRISVVPIFIILKNAGKRHFSL